MNLLIQRVLLNIEVKQLYLCDGTTGLFNLGRFKWVPLSQFQIVDDDSSSVPPLHGVGWAVAVRKHAKANSPMPHITHTQSQKYSWSTGPLVASKCDSLIELHTSDWRRMLLCSSALCFSAPKHSWPLDLGHTTMSGWSRVRKVPKQVFMFCHWSAWIIQS